MKTMTVSLVTLAAASMLSATAALAQPKTDDMKTLCKDMMKEGCMDRMKGMDMGMSTSASAPTAAAHAATGVVKSVDAKAGTVTVAHDPVKSINWPAMTMAFKVKDPGLLGKFTAGEKATFEFRQEGKDYVITSVE